MLSVKGLFWAAFANLATLLYFAIHYDAILARFLA